GGRGLGRGGRGVPRQGRPRREEAGAGPGFPRPAALGQRFLQHRCRNESAADRGGVYSGEDALLQHAGTQPAASLGRGSTHCFQTAAITAAMSEPMRLRKAGAADLALLPDWDTKPHVVAASGADEPYEWKSELPRDLAWREFLIAEVDGKPIGFLQIIDPAVEETHYWGAIEPNLRAIDIWIGEEGNL